MWHDRYVCFTNWWYVSAPQLGWLHWMAYLSLRLNPGEYASPFYLILSYKHRYPISSEVTASFFGTVKVMKSGFNLQMNPCECITTHRRNSLVYYVKKKLSCRILGSAYGLFLRILLILYTFWERDMKHCMLTFFEACFELGLVACIYNQSQLSRAWGRRIVNSRPGWAT